MKMRNFETRNTYHITRITTFLTFVSLFFVGLVAVPAQAEETVDIQLRIEGPANTFLNATISVPQTCSVIDTTTTTPHNFTDYSAICALQTTQEHGLLTYQVTDWGWGFSLDEINGVAGATDWSQLWILRINNATAQTGIDGLILNPGDNLLITYGPWPMEPLQITYSTSTFEVNAEINLQAKVWDDATNNFVEFANKSTFWIDDNIYESNSGTLLWTADSEGPKKVQVEAEGKTRSSIQTIDIILPPTTEPVEPTTSTYHVNVNYLNEEIFNNDVMATSTWFYDADGALFSTSTVSALGVLAEASRQGDFPLTIQGGWGYYVSEINGYAAQGFDGWIYNINLQDPGWVGMNDYLIQPDDLLTVFYSVWPWKVESNTSSIYLGENVNFTAFNYASSTWQASPSTTISVNNQLFVTDDSGQYTHTPSATGTLSAFIYGSDSWPTNSPTISVEVLEQAPTSTLPADETPPPADNGGGSGGGGGGNDDDKPPAIPIISDADINTAVDKILAYLESQQDATGKIIDGGITDWAIMSFASAGTYSDEIKNGGQSLLDYALNYDFTDSSDLNLCAAYPRHILALLAAGIDTTATQITELKNKINSQCVNEAAYGQKGINDDIFGLFALLATDENINATSTKNIVAAIKSDQTADGAFTWAGWPGADITGGAINALKYAETKGASIEQKIYSNAKNYLKTAQLPDGGWGYGVSDALTTSWAVMGLNALGETSADWFTSSSTTPWHVLVNQLNDIGYYESAWVPGTTDWFATKHAVPALLGKSWPIVLPPLATTQADSSDTTTNNSSGASSNSTNTSSATTTLEVEQTTENPTSTTQITTTPTSTIELAIETPTSTVATTTVEEETGNWKLETNEQPAESLAKTISTTKPITPITYHPSPTSPPTTSATNTDNETVGQLDSGVTISSAPENTLPINKTAKGVFAGATSLAGALGLYLAWRFIQTMI